ncbi:MAG: hypothetical protein KJZ78_01875 [Bryobacteraceae bacterium]|nr:hypothetical protein [Bryobacteraceae bacterium]
MGDGRIDATMESSVAIVVMVAMGSIELTVVIVSIDEIVNTGEIGTIGVMGAIEPIGVIGAMGLIGGIGEIPIQL